MTRSEVRSLLHSLRRAVGWGCLAFAALLLSGPASAASPSYPSVRMFGAEYVDAQDFARRFGLSHSWSAPGREVRLKSRWTTIELAANSVEAELNGLRLFLSAPVVVNNGRLYLSRGDVEQLFTPILVPATVGARRVKTIVVDAGHGGADPGNQNRALKLREKTYTLDVAKRLQRLLVAEGFRVIMTRTTDRTVSLDRRAAIANRSHADLFISIHFNGFSDSRVRGAETYVMTPRLQRSTPQAERDRRMVTTRFPANRHDRQNALLGYHLHRSLIDSLGAPDRGLKRFRYSVLRSVNCPAVLVEAAFLSNPQEARRVATAAHRQKIAGAIAAGVRRHAAALERNAQSRRR